MTKPLAAVPVSSPWVVHKFGGTSVANADRYRTVAGIMSTETGARKAIVVSAMSKVTDALIELVQLAKLRDESYLSKLELLKKRHLDTVEALLPAESATRAELAAVLLRDFEDIREVLRGVWLVRTDSERIVELVSGYGEVWSAQFLRAHLATRPGSENQARWLDARQVLIVEPGATPTAPVTIHWELSRAKLDAWLAAHPCDWLVVTGFVASTEDGIAATLKRNGSDFSASIFGALLDAQSISIWTDVDGVLSADPRLVPEAVVLPEMSYQEATELAYFGAKVVHPSTMAPAIDRGIPIWIRNTFNPSCRGTKIHGNPVAGPENTPVKGFATIDQVALVNVEGTGMMGVPGVAERLFGALKEVGVSVVMISQASSEHSICFAIPSTQSELARKTVERAFYAELHHGQIQKVEVSDSCTILAAVGDEMANRPGVAARFFSALGRTGVSVRAIAQGSSERNISVVIPRADATRALRAVHSGFFLSNQAISIGIIGIGWIGATLLRQLEEAIPRLRRDQRIDLRVRAVADSRHMVLRDRFENPARATDDVKDSTIEVDLDDFAAHVHADHLPHAVIIDCTASETVARLYPAWLSSGLHVITPNKKANTAEQDFFERLRATTRQHQRHYLYETTVGAGLPVLNTLRDLVQTGDDVLEIEGVLSGTLSYLFNTFSPERPFSSVVFEARDQGFTEPDPRDDLSGMDVARKLVILGREMGLKLDLSDVRVESLVPAELRSGSLESFLKDLPKMDAPMLQLLADAIAAGECLRYVGRISPKGEASVALQRYPKHHPFARLGATDNCVAFRTRRYHAQPLIVQGPGAGPEVTAAGVFADLLRLCAYLGAAP